MQHRLAKMVAVASLYSHPAADADVGLKRLNELYDDAVSCLHYVGVESGDGLMAERIDAAKRYKELRDSGQLTR